MKKFLYILVFIPQLLFSQGIDSLNLKRVEIHPNIIYSSGKITEESISFWQGDHAAFAFSEHDTMGVIISEKGSWNYGKVDGEYKMFLDSIGGNYSCEKRYVSNNRTFETSNNQTTTTSKCINLYWEIDNDLYLNKGANTAFYIQGLYNVCQLLFSRDSIHTNLQTLFIWDTPDPYYGLSTNAYLNQFDSVRMTGYAGDVGHLIGLNGGGGVAYVNTLPYAKWLRTGYSAIGTTYNSDLSVYSWSVDCICHEHGHVFGSDHTHDCVWNGNNTRVDDCGTHAGYGVVGACGADIPDPVGGALLMSYGQLRPCGKKLSLGFGTQGRDTVLQRINRATTITTVCNCQLPSPQISGFSEVHKMSTSTYSATLISGASYHWVLPPSAIGLSTTNSISVNFLDTYAGGDICVSATNACGEGISACKTVDVDLSGEVLNIQELFNDRREDTKIFDLYGREVFYFSSGFYIVRKGNSVYKIVR